MAKAETKLEDKAARKAARKLARANETPEERKARKEKKKAKLARKAAKELKKKRKRAQDASGDSIAAHDPGATPPRPAKRARSSVVKPVEPAKKAKKAEAPVDTKAKATLADGKAFRVKNAIEILGRDEQNQGSYAVPEPILSYSECPFDKRVVDAMMREGFTSPTPIQAQAWPICRQGRDIISVARTGSGKTLGFLLPVFEKIASLEKKRIRSNAGGAPGSVSPLAIVLAPTRELAMQIEVEATKFSRSVGVRCGVVYGGESKWLQIRKLNQTKPQLIVATPGRLNDLCQMRKISLGRVAALVLDEADRMLDMGFEPQLMDIQRMMPKQLTGDARPLPSSGQCDQFSRQTLLFSATWPRSVQAVATRFLVNPVQLNVGQSNVLVANENIKQTVMVVTPSEKVRR